MFCQRCGMNNREGSQFCAGCAAPFYRYQQPRFHQGHGAQAHSFNQGYGAHSQVQAKASGRSIAAMLMSLTGMIFCFMPFTIAGMILGKSEMNAIQTGQASPAGSGFARTGFIVGLSITVIHALFILAGVLQALLRTN